MCQKKIRIGVTGGIGSGKSYVLQCIAAKGFPIYSTDEAAKRLMVNSQQIRDGLVSLLGEDVYLPNGQLNKALVATYLFQGEGYAQKINSIVHPEVAKDFLQWSSIQQNKVVFMECAILYETGFDALVDEVVLVSAPKDVRIRRVVARDGLSAEDVLNRMASQMQEDDRIARVHYIIKNDGETNVEEQLEQILNEIVK